MSELTDFSLFSMSHVHFHYMKRKGENIFILDIRDVSKWWQVFHFYSRAGCWSVFFRCFIWGEVLGNDTEFLQIPLKYLLVKMKLLNVLWNTKRNKTGKKDSSIQEKLSIYLSIHLSVCLSIMYFCKIYFFVKKKRRFFLASGQRL